MSEAHRREKNPERVRQMLVDNACRLASEKGLAAVSIQQVSAAAGVTKGAFFHHFTNKQALVDAVFSDMLSEFEQELEEGMSRDSVEHGRFTRAYLKLVTESEAQESRWISVWVSMIADDALRSVWHEWFGRQFASVLERESTPELQAVRMAADGIWLTQLAGMHTPDNALDSLLLRMTYP